VVDSIVRVQQNPAGDRDIDNSEVDNAAGIGGKAHRQRTEPYGARRDAVTHLASSALPGAGAFTVQGFTDIEEGITEASFVVTYTRGAAGGFPILRPQWTDGSKTISPTTVNKTPESVNGYARRRLFLEELRGIAPDDANPLSFDVSFGVPRTATGVRLLAAEGGVVGLPGTIEISIAEGSAP
jgi:hypothetical protein